MQLGMRTQIIAGGALLLLPIAGWLWNKRSQANKVNGGLVIGIELGGTNYNVAVGEAVLGQHGQVLDFRILKRRSGNTYQDPEQALSQIREFIESCQQSSILQQPGKTLDFIGIASFGPLSLAHNSPDFGCITTTPKQKWRGVNVLNQLAMPYANRTAIDTDVNAAAYAQFRLGRHQGVRESLAYVTVGTGVGVGVIANGKCVHGLTHPEGGHILAKRHPQELQYFRGVCPFHGDCIEGMVCNHAIAQRLKVQFTALADVAEDSPIWKLVGHYLAQLCLSITLLLSPQVIVLGGGVMNRVMLYDIVRDDFLKLLHEYVDHPLLKPGQVENYIKAPRLGSDVGVKGAMALGLM